MWKEAAAQLLETGGPTNPVVDSVLDICADRCHAGIVADL
jgi:hypothetical protein